MKNLLWLDDIRNPFINEEGKVPTDKNGEYYNISWVLNYEQFVKWIELFGLPDAISFDHDLADEHYTPEYFWDNYEESKKFQEWRGQNYQEKTGMDCAKWLVDYCMDNKKKLPEIFIHSANPVGADNIKGLLDKCVDTFNTIEEAKENLVYFDGTNKTVMILRDTLPIINRITYRLKDLQSKANVAFENRDKETYESINEQIRIVKSILSEDFS